MIELLAHCFGIGIKNPEELDEGQIYKNIMTMFRKSQSRGLLITSFNWVESLIKGAPHSIAYPFKNLMKRAKIKKYTINILGESSCTNIIDYIENRFKEIDLFIKNNGYCNSEQGIEVCDNFIDKTNNVGIKKNISIDKINDYFISADDSIYSITLNNFSDLESAETAFFYKLFKFTDSIDIIDAYIGANLNLDQFNDNHRVTLNWLVNFLEKTWEKKKFKQINIITAATHRNGSDSSSDFYNLNEIESFFDDWMEDLEVDFEIKIMILPYSNRGKKFPHQRLLITNQFSLMLEHGFNFIQEEDSILKLNRNGEKIIVKIQDESIVSNIINDINSIEASSDPIKFSSKDL